MKERMLCPAMGLFVVKSVRCPRYSCESCPDRHKPRKEDKVRARPKRHKNAGWQVRDPFWDDMNQAWEILRSDEHRSIREAVRGVSYLRDVDRSDLVDAFFYQLASKTGDSEDRISGLVETCIRFLKAVLEGGLVYVFRFGPDSVTWFLDVFGASADRYMTLTPLGALPTACYERRSRNAPQYGRSYLLFIEFLRGTSYKQLGVNESHFVSRYRPQGMLVLLHRIHHLLHGKAEDEWRLQTSIEAALREVTANVPRPVLRRILKRLSA